MLTHGFAGECVQAKWFQGGHYRRFARPRHLDFAVIRPAGPGANRPKLIICGYSAYPRTIDFAPSRAIARRGRRNLLADMAHIAGLVAAGVHPSPHSRIAMWSTTTTPQDPAVGPAAGPLILTNDAGTSAAQFDKAVFPAAKGGRWSMWLAARRWPFERRSSQAPGLTASRWWPTPRPLAGAADRAAGLRVVSGGTG